MSRSVTPRSSLLPRIKSTKTSDVTNSMFDQVEYRPGAIHHLDQILKCRTQDLHQAENKLTNAKALLAYLAIYAMIATIVAIAAIGGVL